ncbi:hypothetical protein ACFC0S_16930 [Streptomyces sp. NPDC056084]|uniref:hypothetical protein n=1 Tax=unclassified Streptomyces TaxID=2593676 RepID=UPI0035D94684
MNDTPASWPCEICRRPSVPRVHAGCQERLDDNLAQLPHRYRALAEALAPARRGSDGRTGSRTAPLPVNERVLDLRARGGIEGVVTSWERDARDLLGWSPPPFRGSIEQTIDGAVAFLLANTGWFCDQHPAIYEFAQDIRRLRSECDAILGGEPRPRRIPVTCPCGTVLRVTLDTPGRQCGGCGIQYGHSDLFELPLAERNAA